MADDTRSLADRLGELYRTSAAGPVNISAASRSLGVSRHTVRRMLAGTASPRGEAALSRAERIEQHKPAWIVGAHEGVLPGKLFPDGIPRMPGERDVPAQIDLIASRKPDGTINLTRTARALGVSARTLGRWVRGEARPKAMHQEDIRSEVRATVLSRSDAAMDASTTGMHIGINALVQISSDRKRRYIGKNYSAAEVAAAQMAWQLGGNEGLQQWFATHLEQVYFGGAGIDASVPIDVDEVT